jgi:hypothetical protein
LLGIDAKKNLLICTIIGYSNRRSKHGCRSAALSHGDDTKYEIRHHGIILTDKFQKHETFSKVVVIPVMLCIFAKRFYVYSQLAVQMTNIISMLLSFH